MIAVLSLIVGCGGGGSSSGGGAVTSTFHVQDQNNNALVGVLFNYTDPAGVTHTTNASDSNGNLTVISNQVGTYTIVTGSYNGASYNFTQGTQIQNSAADISNNVRVAYNVEVDIIRDGFAIFTLRQVR